MVGGFGGVGRAGGWVVGFDGVDLVLLFVDEWVWLVGWVGGGRCGVDEFVVVGVVFGLYG